MEAESCCQFFQIEDRKRPCQERSELFSGLERWWDRCNRQIRPTRTSEAQAAAHSAKSNALIVPRLPLYRPIGCQTFFVNMTFNVYSDSVIFAIFPIYIFIKRSPQL